MDIWLKAAENGKISAALLLDLSAGFDVIIHEILFSKLQEYGLDDISISWFENYLSQRSPHNVLRLSQSFPRSSMSFGVYHKDPYCLSFL